MRKRQLLVVAGLAAFALGVVALAAPGVVGLGVRRYVVSLAGLLALWQLLKLARRRLGASPRTTATPDVARTPPIDPPGQSFDAVFDRYGDDVAALGVRGRLQTRLARLVTDVLDRYGDDATSPDDAVRSGNWTDDPEAAAFLGGLDAPSPGLGARIADRVRGRTTFQRRRGSAVAELAALAGVDTAGDTPRRSWPRRLRRSLGGLGRSPDASGWTTAPLEAAVTRPTGRWHGTTVVAMAAIGVGVLTDTPALLFVGAVAVAYAGHARLTAPPDPTLAVERSLTPSDPDPDTPVEITVTVENEGDRTLPDLKPVDGVPRGLSVVEGSATAGTALRPGGEITLAYTVTARRGTHEFGPLAVLARDTAGAREVEATVPVTGGTDLCCRPRLGSLDRPAPTRTHATRRGGLVETTESGAGTEFFGVREYERGDPLAWIDWNRLARTGEFATLQFREQRAVTVVFVVDATGGATAGPPDADETAAQRCVAAAGRLVGTALDGGNHAGFAAVGPAACWLAPGAGRSHRVAVRDLLARTPALVPGHQGEPPSERWATDLRQRLPADAQVVVLSPLCDDRIATGVRRLHADGYPVTVLSPDPTARRSDPERVAAVTRRLRLTDLRAGGVPVLDWDWDDPLDVALADWRARR